MKNVIIAKDVYELLIPEQSFLSRSDVRIRTADSNSQAAALHRAEKTDLIIAYLDTEEMSGEELCRQIREDSVARGVSILLICGVQEAEISRCVSCNANAYITMPIASAVLLQEAHRLLNIAPRKNCRVPVKIRLECELRGKRFVGMIENISTAGLFFRSPSVIPEGSTVHCTFKAGEGREVTVAGEIVRMLHDEPMAGYGVSFFDISTEAASSIGRLSGAKKACNDLTERAETS
jgi:DNA-binding response OmpR family regulator